MEDTYLGHWVIVAALSDGGTVTVDRELTMSVKIS